MTSPVLGRHSGLTESTGSVNSCYSDQARDLDPETHFKDTFRVFSKDEEGEIKLSNTPFSTFTCSYEQSMEPIILSLVWFD